MQVNFDTMRTKVFAVSHRLMGYKLLKNPAGAPKNEVNMIRTWFGVIGLHNDKCYHYERIRRHKEGDRFIKDKTLLISEYFIDPDTKTFSGRRKNITGYTEKSGDCKSLEKTYMTPSEYDNRPLPKWDDYDKVWGFSKDEYALRREMHKKGKSEYTKPGFWEILRLNLKG